MRIPCKQSVLMYFFRSKPKNKNYPRYTKWGKFKTDFQISQNNVKQIISIQVLKLFYGILPYLLSFY